MSSCYAIPRPSSSQSYTVSLPSSLTKINFNALAYYASILVSNYGTVLNNIQTFPEAEININTRFSTLLFKLISNYIISIPNIHRNTQKPNNHPTWSNLARKPLYLRRYRFVLYFTLLIPVYSFVIGPYYLFQNHSYTFCLNTQCLCYYINLFIISVIMLDSIYYLEHAIRYIILC